jgi:hypothetical protein
MRKPVQRAGLGSRFLNWPPWPRSGRSAFPRTCWVDQELIGRVWSAAGGYWVRHRDGTRLNGLPGARLLDVDTKAGLTRRRSRTLPDDCRRPSPPTSSLLSA